MRHDCIGSKCQAVTRCEDLLLTQQVLLGTLASQQARRREYPGTTWLDVEIDVMHHAVNCDRAKRGLPDINRAAVERVERMACGHSDYSSKFSLYCAELALGSRDPQP
jgi:hypothetical protein